MVISQSRMELKLRSGTPADAEVCGRICYNAFKTISEAHGFVPDFPAPEVAIDVLTRMLANPKFYSVVAEIDGRIVGSNFLDERNRIAGVGPITVDPAVQNRAIGRRLMDAVHERAAEKNFAGVRLIQAGFHTRSLSLYAKLGYDVREYLACMQGNTLGISIEGHVVRPATEADINDCNRLCQQVHGHDRGGELKDAIAQGSATRGGARGTNHRVRHDRRFFRPRRGGDKQGYEGAHRRSEGIRRSRVSSPDAQRRAISLVSEQWLTNRAANDFDEQRAVQRTSGSIPAIDLVLAGFARLGSNRYGVEHECVINLFERILATRGYRFAGGHRYRN